MNKTLEWVKANLLIIVFSVLILGAFVILPFLSSGMNQTVKRELEGRKGLERDLTSLRTTGVSLQDPTPWFTPPQQSAALVNPSALGEFDEYATAHVEEAERVLEAAEEFNRRGRQPLVDGVYPEPRMGEKDIKIAAMSEALRAAYQALLDEIEAGAAPSLDDMKDELIRQRSQYIAVTAQADDEESLTDEQRAELGAMLSASRMAFAEEAARRLKVFATLDAINPPGWSIGQTQPSPTELFEWQWDFWAIQDILLAIDRANSDATSVVDAPVKRLVSVVIVESTAGGGSARSSEQRRGNTGGEQSGGPRLSGGGNDLGGSPPPGGGTPPPGTTGQAPAGDQTFDQAKALEMVRKFDLSMTGRTSNSLYDVRTVRVHLVVQTDLVAQVLDAISSQNLMTITGMSLWPADPYAALESGYMYGPAAVSELALDVETVWLRSWTAQYMPNELKSALKIPTGTEGGAAAPPATQ